jgi:hypothetical protein
VLFRSSGDGLGTYLGRFKDARIRSDVTKADLHFSPSAHNTPDGDLAQYVMDLARDDPAAFGASIVYAPDAEAEEEHYTEHSPDGQYRSPDELNTGNLPHARLSKLHATDIVDEPAANPSGLFHRQDIAHQADATLSYICGLTDKEPEATALSIHPTRLHTYVAKFLADHHLQITRDNPMATEPVPDDTAALPIDAPPDPAPEPAPAPPAEPAEPQPAAEPTAMADDRAALRHFMATFGAEAGARYYCDGLTELEAHRKALEAANTENRRLAALLRQSAGEATPVSASPDPQHQAPASTKDLVRIRRA